MKTISEKSCVECSRTHTPKWRGIRKNKPICNTCFFKNRRYKAAEKELLITIKAMREASSDAEAREIIINSNVLLSNSKLKCKKKRENE